MKDVNEKNLMELQKLFNYYQEQENTYREKKQKVLIRMFKVIARIRGVN